MNPKQLRFRQVHLDFHTSPDIPGIGSAFNQKEWQETLKRGAVDSITVFSKCHHGWSYHPTQTGKMHPHLSFDLLRAQIDACREIDVKTPIYLSAGVDNLASYEHPEWREVGPEGTYTGWARSPLQAGFHKLCFFSPYLDYLCRQIEEAARLFPEADGIFLDIVSQGPSCTRWALAFMVENGLDPENPADRDKAAKLGLKRYYEATTAACQVARPEMPVFHNSGHIERGSREILKYFSHLELESLPTGGWGYDHFPASAKYCAKLGLDFLGMTGKFHTTWGEFGGYKHPNALRYECAAMLAFGAKCSIGDQLHPDGRLDLSTYELMGAAYHEVEAKEPWCRDAVSQADVAVLSSAAEQFGKPGHKRDYPADTGACRILLEGHFPFDLIDRAMDFHPYKAIILPDEILLDYDLNEKLQRYVAAGGSLLMTGSSGLASDRSRFAFDLGVEFEGPSPFQPDYVLPIRELRPSFVDSPMVVYLHSQRIRTTHGGGLGQVFEPYFNRSWRHFCSHQHAPPKPEPSGYDMGVERGRLMYLAHPWFSLYRGLGAVAYKEIVLNALRRLLKGATTIGSTNLPSTARISLMRQESERRSILHLLFANTVNRGGDLELAGGTVSSRIKSVEVIEDLVPLRDVKISLRMDRPAGKITLEPGGRPCRVEREADGRLNLHLDQLLCHEMVVVHDA
jgi:hypothetical protein